MPKLSVAHHRALLVIDGKLNPITTDHAAESLRVTESNLWQNEDATISIKQTAQGTITRSIHYHYAN